ncbi:MAG: hypothetical protein HYZ07_02420 [Candidatus Harrisonbacteria bacterium]|nr:hypothetical protein [Candidatus Harrisonbacteria bacterium]MBI2406447.1 hypothetical protein [Candidatus Harrisonbacteria bacterium]MBI2604171.1 hypothetical protein [Candidatus Harrisonbacteria bacterium]MBI3114792.1 hypothetical protein [Candidatus Harrisonbacteria bacterium]
MPELPNNSALFNDQDTGGVPWKIFLLSLLLLAAVGAGYAGVRFGYVPYVQGKLIAVNAQIAELTGAIPEKEQANLIRFYSQIVNLKGLLDRHVAGSKMLQFLEARTNAALQYTNVGVNAARRELALEGLTLRYETLAEQLESLRQAPEVQAVLLNESRIAEGKLRFRITATLAPQLFRE